MIDKQPCGGIVAITQLLDTYSEANGQVILPLAHFNIVSTGDFIYNI